MAKTKISEFSSTPANNTDIDSINIAEGCAPSGINDAIRELMAQLKEFQTGAAGDSFNGPVGTTTAAAGAFTTLAASGAVTLSGGTANGVAYLNGSKVLTTGSALTFDGANLNFGGTSQRITGDFSNATLASRVIFQSSTTNGASGVISIPNGTGVIASWSAQNSSDVANGANIAMRASDTDMSVRSGITGTGTYLPMTFFTGGSERMRVDTSGNFGIGTTSPGAKLDVAGNLRLSAANPAIEFNNGGPQVYSTSANTLQFATGGGIGSATERMRIDSSGNLGLGTSSPAYRLDVSHSSFDVARFVTTASNTDARVNIEGLGTGLGALNSVRNGLVFQVAGTERARIDSSGQFLFNCTGKTGDAPNAAGGRITELNGNEKVRVAADTQVAFQFYSPTGGTGGPVGSIIVNAASVSYNTSSDYRLKHDIQPMTGALAKVAQLKPVTYKWNANDSQSQGFIAHELQEVVPECVTGEKDAVDAEGKPVYQGIDTSFLVATLTAAIQEQQAIIQTLTARVAALESN
jgi:hypothetical protein